MSAHVLTELTLAAKVIEEIPWPSTYGTVNVSVSRDTSLDIHACGRRGLEELLAAPGIEWDRMDDEYGNPRWLSTTTADVEVTYFR